MRFAPLSMLCATLLLGATAGYAAQADATPPADPAPAAQTGANGKLVLLFASSSDELSSDNALLLDKASRVYREGHPIVMIVTGSADSVGAPVSNLLLSQRRANAVVRGLLARGIPADRTQILAKGVTSPAVNAPRGTAEPQNRRVEISWR